MRAGPLTMHTAQDPLFDTDPPGNQRCKADGAHTGDPTRHTPPLPQTCTACRPPRARIRRHGSGFRPVQARQEPACWRQGPETSSHHRMRYVARADCAAFAYFNRLADVTSGTSAAYWQPFIDCTICDRTTSFDMGPLTKPVLLACFRHAMRANHSSGDPHLTATVHETSPLVGHLACAPATPPPSSSISSPFGL